MDSAQEFAQALRTVAVSDPPVASASPASPAEAMEKPAWVPGQKDARKDAQKHFVSQCATCAKCWESSCPQKPADHYR